MRKLLLVFAGVLVMVSCNQFGQNNNEPAADNGQIDSLEQALNQKEDEMNELMDRLGDIQDGLDRISEAEGRINTLTSGEVPVENVTADIEENMQYIENTMAENRQRIADLQVRLNRSTINTTRLQQQLESLQKRFNDKVREINDLKEELAHKNIQIKALTDTVATLAIENEEVKADNAAKQKVVEKQEAQITEATNELNTAYYVYGTKDELRKHGIMQSSKFRLSEETDLGYFTKIDTRNFKSLALNSKSAELLSAHPDGSYSLVKDANGSYSLNITDAKAFWSASKYLVVRVK